LRKIRFTIVVGK